MKLENVKLEIGSQKRTYFLVWEEKDTCLNCGADLIDPFDFEFPLCYREELIEAPTKVMKIKWFY